jgi:hydrogenase maturation protein HypF
MKSAPPVAQPRVARRALVRGTVQGVGFRPFVCGLAVELGLDGWVRNERAGVVLVVEGAEEDVAAFAQRLARDLPAPGAIVSVEWTELEPSTASGFEILPPAQGADAPTLSVPADLAPCEACLAEIADPSSRRHGYAFTSCVRCGPRHSIVEALPWHRASTSMSGFALCESCEADFARRGDRREHAETLACPACGPRLRLVEGERSMVEGDDALRCAVLALRRGSIVAVLGVGGFLLCCDARSDEAVRKLRERKRRPREPFAVLVADFAAASAIARPSDAEREALRSPAAPIVTVRARDGALAHSVTCGLARVGLMLPAAPLLWLVARDFGGPLVATSANHHGEAIAATDAELSARGAGLADFVLSHDRRIVRRIDDSVVQVAAGRVRCLRMGRGLAPRSLELDVPGASLVAHGAHLRAAPAILRGSTATLLPHVGDLGSASQRDAFSEAIDRSSALFAHEAEVSVIDAHPDYGSTLLAEARGGRLERVWHHHAHVAACLAENQASEALGFAWDGTGLGSDGELWGGEALEVGPRGARRVATLRSFPLPGGDAASRDGRRALAGLLAELGLDSRTPLVSRHVPIAWHPALAPRTSSLGRLFDAVAALTGVCSESSYEGEAAIRLEQLAEPGAEPYALPIDAQGVIDWGPMLREMLADPSDAPRIASRLHASLVEVTVRVSELRGSSRVALSGGCFANRLLLEGAHDALRARGIEVLTHAIVPPGDGGLALGQLWVAAHRLGQA